MNINSLVSGDSMQKYSTSDKLSLVLKNRPSYHQTPISEEQQKQNSLFEARTCSNVARSTQQVQQPNICSPNSAIYTYQQSASNTDNFNNLLSKPLKQQIDFVNDLMNDFLYYQQLVRTRNQAPLLLVQQLNSQQQQYISQNEQLQHFQYQQLEQLLHEQQQLSQLVTGRKNASVPEITHILSQLKNKCNKINESDAQLCLMDQMSQLISKQEQNNSFQQLNDAILQKLEFVADLQRKLHLENVDFAEFRSVLGNNVNLILYNLQTISDTGKIANSSPPVVNLIDAAQFTSQLRQHFRPETKYRRRSQE